VTPVTAPSGARDGRAHGQGRATAPGRAGSKKATMVSALFSRGAALLAAGLVAGCTASSEEVQPQRGSIFFPTGLAVSPDEAFMFVASANSDLRFDSGTIEVADLAAIEQVVDAWKTAQTVPPGCAASTDERRTLLCPTLGDVDLYVREAGVRTGNFAVAIGVQDVGGGNLRLIVPVRGDPSVTWIDWDGASRRLRCSDAQGFTVCDELHRLVHLRGDKNLPNLPAEPFGVYVDSLAEFATVTHLSSGTVTLVDTPKTEPPVLADSITGLFAPNGVNATGTSAVAGRKPGPDNVVYVQSNTEDRVQLISVARPDVGFPFLIPTSYFFLESVIGQGGSSDSRGIAFAPDGNRAFMINRRPPSLQVFDTSLGLQGTPRNLFLGGTDICREASSVVAGDAGGGLRVFVSCFNDGEVYVIDPRAGAAVEAVATVGRGPFGLAISPTRQLLFVTNFLGDSLAVIDLDPASETLYRVVLRIGERS